MTRERFNVVAIVLAAGAGERLGGGTPKAFVELAGRSMVARAAAAAASCADVTELVVASPPSEAERRRVVEALDGTPKPVRVVAGGASRQSSVLCALEAASNDVDIVVVHDAARPLAPPSLFSSVIEALDRRRSDAAAAIPVVPVVDTLKRVAGGFVVETVARDDLRAAQTPQAFAAEALRSAHERAAAAAMEFTDDAALLEWAGHRVIVVAGDPANLKVTTAEDVRRAEAAIAQRRGDENTGSTPPLRAEPSRHG
jgi:2-C-methyl-D-erythritol 4-phosphate cytidylyltransferase